MKILSQETNLESDITVDNATVVRTYNNADTSTTVIRKDSGGSTVGSLTIPSKKLVYLEKKSNDTLIGDSTVKASKIAYSPMMQYASWLEGGGAPSYDTVTNSNSWSTLTDSGSVDGTLSQNLLNCTTVPKSGKRVYFILFTYRLTGTEAYADYEDYFKPSGQGGGASVLLSGHTPTYIACAKTQYNATALYAGTSDLNTSGSNQTITFVFDDNNQIPGGANNPGGWAVSIRVFDYVEEFAQNTQVLNANSAISTNGPVNVAPGGTGSGWTSSFKYIGGVASNPGNDVNPLYTAGTGENADTTPYVVQQSGDNGSNEVTQTSAAFKQNGQLSNITGTMGLDSGQADTGLGIIATHVRFKPSS